MAERLKIKLLDSDRLVDLVAGPDAYRDIPRLLDTIEVTSELPVCRCWCMCACWKKSHIEVPVGAADVSLVILY